MEQDLSQKVLSNFNYFTNLLTNDQGTMLQDFLDYVDQKDLDSLNQQKAEIEAQLETKTAAIETNLQERLQRVQVLKK